jgi:2-polyprenyl-3-methyl-5-hydroxy-6-metoxy-1,4-benzoquinol methylase
MLDSSIYRRAYNEATYRLDLQDKYASIRALPEDRSDNKQRVRRVIAFSKRMGQRPQKASVLDIGSGLCVFLGEMKDVGYSCFCLDPDPFAVDHALKTVCVDGAYAGTLDDYKPDRAFDIITLNKVLEHVPDPARMLKQAAELLAPNGFIYIELPDGEAALKEGAAFDREEFYIEHFTIFTWDSFRRLTEMAGVKVVEMESIHEPSDKFTLYGFLVGGKEEYE